SAPVQGAGDHFRAGWISIFTLVFQGEYADSPGFAVILLAVRVPPPAPGHPPAPPSPPAPTEPGPPLPPPAGPGHGAGHCSARPQRSDERRTLGDHDDTEAGPSGTGGTGGATGTTGTTDTTGATA